MNFIKKKIKVKGSKKGLHADDEHFDPAFIPPVKAPEGAPEGWVPYEERLDEESEEWQQFKQLTSRVTETLQKTQDNLTKIVATSALPEVVDPEDEEEDSLFDSHGRPTRAWLNFVEDKAAEEQNTGQPSTGQSASAPKVVEKLPTRPPPPKSSGPPSRPPPPGAGGTVSQPSASVDLLGLGGQVAPSNLPSENGFSSDFFEFKQSNNFSLNADLSFSVADPSSIPGFVQIESPNPADDGEDPFDTSFVDAAAKGIVIKSKPVAVADRSTNFDKLFEATTAPPTTPREIDDDDGDSEDDPFTYPSDLGVVKTSAKVSDNTDDINMFTQQVRPRSPNPFMDNSHTETSNLNPFLELMTGKGNDSTASDPFDVLRNGQPTNGGSKNPFACAAEPDNSTVDFFGVTSTTAATSIQPSNEIDLLGSDFGAGPAMGTNDFGFGASTTTMQNAPSSQIDLFSELSSESTQPTTSIKQNQPDVIDLFGSTVNTENEKTTDTFDVFATNASRRSTQPDLFSLEPITKPPGAESLSRRSSPSATEDPFASEPIPPVETNENKVTSPPAVTSRGSIDRGRRKMSLQSISSIPLGSFSQNDVKIVSQRRSSVDVKMMTVLSDSSDPFDPFSNSAKPKRPEPFDAFDSVMEPMNENDGLPPPVTKTRIEIPMELKQNADVLESLGQIGPKTPVEPYNIFDLATPVPGEDDDIIGFEATLAMTTAMESEEITKRDIIKEEIIEEQPEEIQEEEEKEEPVYPAQPKFDIFDDEDIMESAVKITIDEAGPRPPSDDEEMYKEETEPEVEVTTNVTDVPESDDTPASAAEPEPEPEPQFEPEQEFRTEPEQEPLPEPEVEIAPINIDMAAFDAFEARFESVARVSGSQDEFDPFGGSMSSFKPGDKVVQGFEGMDSFDPFLGMIEPTKAPQPSPAKFSANKDDDSDSDDSGPDFSVVIRPKMREKVDKDDDQLGPPPLLPPPPKSPARSPTHSTPRYNPFEVRPTDKIVEEVDFSDFGSEYNTVPVSDFPLPDLFETKKEIPRTESQESAGSILFEEDDSQPLEEYPPKYEKPGWEMVLRQPNKKKITGQRFWKKVFVRLHDHVLQLFSSADDKDPFQELPLQACYSLSEISAQQFDQFGKIFTVKLQYIFYRERVGVRPGQISKVAHGQITSFGQLAKLGLPLEHAPQISQLLKLGHAEYPEMKKFLLEVEDALFRLSVHRDRALTYKTEEIQVTVQDETFCDVSKTGHVNKQLARVRVFFLAFISGMPHVEVGVNDLHRKGKEVVGRHDIIPVVTEEWIRLEDIEFHACVSQEEFQKNRIIKLHPPDACFFELLRFRVRPPKNRELPLQIKAQITVGGTRVEIRSDILVPGYSGRKHGQIPCEDVCIKFPLPECWIYLFRTEKHFRYGSVKSASRRAGKIKGLERFMGVATTLEPSLIEVSSGQAKYEHHHRAICWRVPRLPKEGQGAYSEHTFVCKLNLTAYDQMPEELAKFAYVEFTMPNTTVSHTVCRSVSVTNPEPPEKHVRYISKHEYIVEIEHVHGFAENEYLAATSVSSGSPKPEKQASKSSKSSTPSSSSPP